MTWRRRYQLESANDLPNFGAVGARFVADKDMITEEFSVIETGQFFRIQKVPYFVEREIVWVDEILLAIVKAASCRRTPQPGGGLEMPSMLDASL